MTGGTPDDSAASDVFEGNSDRRIEAEARTEK
jgi:hypothetical protein